MDRCGKVLLEFWVPGRPVPFHLRVTRLGRHAGYLDAAQTGHQRAVWGAALEAMGKVAGRPFPLQGPVGVVLLCIYPRPDAVHSHHERPIGGNFPDVGNLEKLPVDALTKAGVWNDDRQVAALAVEKLWGDVPGKNLGTWIRVEEL